MNLFREILANQVYIKFFDFYKKTNTGYYLKLFLKSTGWSKDEIENYQVKKIYELLEHAYKNVPFYKKRFDEAGFNYENFNYPDKLKVIPPLTRKDLQENYKNITAKNFDIKKYHEMSSSGSTGTPVIFYHDEFSEGADRAAGMFSKILGGFKLGEPWLNIWGNPTTVKESWSKKSAKLSMFLSNEKRFPSYLLKEDKGFIELTSLASSFNPVSIYGYTNSIYSFSKYLEKNKINLPSVKRVYPTAETLLPYQKESIEKNLGKVYDQYGCREINGVACQSVYDDNYCVLDAKVYVEPGDVVDEENGINKILITDFYNKIFPFIRYDNGDIFSPYEDFDVSASRLKFKRFKSISGRQNDIIELPSGGSLVVPTILSTTTLKNVGGVKQYQIFRTDKNKIEVNLVTDDNFNYESKNKILNSIREFLPDDISCELVFNKEIVVSKTGKHKLFIDLTKEDNLL